MGSYFLQKSRHKTVFYFRRKVPHDLRERLSASQIYQSLKTSDRKLAVVAARRLAAWTDEVFNLVRSMPDKDFKYTPLGQIIERLKIEGPLKEEIEGLRDQLFNSEINAQKRSIRQKAEHEQQLKALIQYARTEKKVPEPIVTMTVREASDKFLASGILKPGSIKRYRSIFDDFGAFVGWSTQLHDITHNQFVRYADMVNARPDKADKTKSNYITTAARLFNWANVRDKRIPLMSATGLKPRRLMPASLDRGAFSPVEIQALFKSVSRDRVTQPHRFWVTIVPAFLGCRIEELAQADLSADILQDDKSGIWYLDINQNAYTNDPSGRLGKKSVKKLSSWRRVPIHSTLVEHGFIDYLEAQKSAGAGTPFELYWKPYRDPATGGVKHAHSPIKWGSRQKKQLVKAGVIRTPKVSYFHSLRHSFITHLAIKGVPIEHRMALCGQESTGGVNTAVYSKLRSNVPALSEIVEKHLDEYVLALKEACS